MLHRDGGSLIRTRESREALFATISELLFILLPFVVIIPVYVYSHRAARVPSHPEWALASALLFGHAIVKLICGAIRVREGSANAIELIVAAGIVFGLAPSLVVLVLMHLMDEPNASPPPGWLIATQTILLVLAVLYFIIFRWLGELLEHSAIEPGDPSAKITSLSVQAKPPSLVKASEASGD